MTGRDGAGNDRRAREDAEWRDIVEHFGERAELSDSELAALDPEPEQPPAYDLAEEPAELAPPQWADDDRYIPPPPPPVPRARGVRLLAWIGLFGVPLLALVGVVLGFSLPSYLGLLLIVWFVAGFGYLVATMSKDESGSGWDDGAVL